MHISFAVKTRLTQSLPIFLHNVHAFHDSTSATRLAQTLLRTLAPILPNATPTMDSTESQGGGAKGKGKKRARGYEGDELLKAGTQASALSSEQSAEIVAALDGEHFDNLFNGHH